MEKSVRLLPVQEGGTTYFSDTVLPLTDVPFEPRLPDVLMEMYEQDGAPLPKPLDSYVGRSDDDEEIRYGNTCLADGSSLLVLPFKRLRELGDLPAVQKYPSNKAAWAYLSMLPDDTMIALHHDE